MTTGIFKWARYGAGYECSSKGDSVFSAFYARMPDGRTIEQHYQCDVKGYDPGGVDWRKGKGKPSLFIMTEQRRFELYTDLWRVWASYNKEAMRKLREKALSKGGLLTDRFATSCVNQAHSLSAILNESVLEEERK